MAVHNRREQTRRCLQRCLAAAPPGVQLTAYVVDDGSTDGTREMLAAIAGVVVVPGDGGLYWGGGMRAAEAVARRARPDFLLWLNDDAELDDDALGRALDLARSHAGDVVVCGALRDPVDGATTYSGARRRARPFLVLDRVVPDPTRPVPVDTFNGNVVLVPFAVAERLGGVDAGFSHHYGDFDYGLRARRLGYDVLLLPGHVGSTARNGSGGSFADRRLSRAARLAAYRGPKGFPSNERWAFLRRHAPFAAPVQFVLADAQHVLRIAMGR